MGPSNHGYVSHNQMVHLAIVSLHRYRSTSPFVDFPRATSHRLERRSTEQHQSMAQMEAALRRAKKRGKNDDGGEFTVSLNRAAG